MFARKLAAALVATVLGAGVVLTSVPAAAEEVAPEITAPAAEIVEITEPAAEPVAEPEPAPEAPAPAPEPPAPAPVEPPAVVEPEPVIEPVSEAPAPVQPAVESDPSPPAAQALTVQTEDKPGQEVCSHTDGWIKVELTSDGVKSVVATAEAGHLVSHTCVKAGQTVVTTDVADAESVTINSPNDKDISHYAYKLVPVVVQEPVKVNLQLTYIEGCPVDATNTWRVRNSSELAVPFTIEYAGQGVVHTGTAASGDTLVDLPRTSATAILKWGSEGIKPGQTVKASGNDKPADHPECAPKVAKLNLTYIQDCAPDTTNTWRIRNESEFAVPFRIEYAGQGQVAEGTAAANGDTFVDLARADVTAILKWGSDGIAAGQKTKASGPDLDCGEQPADDVEVRYSENLDCEARLLTAVFEERTRSYTLVDKVWTPGEWSEFEVVDILVFEATEEECPIVTPTPEPTPEPTPTETPAPVVPAKVDTPKAQATGNLASTNPTGLPVMVVFASLLALAGAVTIGIRRLVRR